MHWAPGSLGFVQSGVVWVCQWSWGHRTWGVCSPRWYAGPAPDTPLDNNHACLQTNRGKALAQFNHSAPRDSIIDLVPLKKYGHLLPNQPSNTSVACTCRVELMYWLGSPLVLTCTSTLSGSPLSPSPQWRSSTWAVFHLFTVSTIHRPGQSAANKVFRNTVSISVETVAYFNCITTFELIHIDASISQYQYPSINIPVSISQYQYPSINISVSITQYQSIAIWAWALFRAVTLCYAVEQCLTAPPRTGCKVICTSHYTLTSLVPCRISTASYPGHLFLSFPTTRQFIWYQDNHLQ